MAVWNENGSFWFYLIITLLVFIIGLILAWVGGHARFMGVGGTCSGMFWAILLFIILIIVYLLMIWGAALADNTAQNNGDLNARNLIRIFWLFSIVLNLLWFIFFYGMKNAILSFFAALFWVVVNIGLILVYTQINQGAGWLFFLYFLFSILALVVSSNVWQRQNTYSTLNFVEKS